MREKVDERALHELGVIKTIYIVRSRCCLREIKNWPNTDINLHIVAPESRRDKVFQEIQRPMFSLLDKGPLSEICSFFTYESINQISSLPHLTIMKDSLIEDYEEFAE